MQPADHISTERLSCVLLTELEQQHLASCVRCRGERRIAEKNGLAPAPAPISPYVLGRLVGSGGMGIVYEARHSALGTRHAVKLLRVPDPLLRARLVREGRLQARLVHQNIVPIDEVVEINGTPALVMPYVEGPTLAQVIGQQALPEEVALALFRAVVSGVAEIHRARLVHRDIKPANILIEVLPGEVVPRVADFGLAKALAAADLSLQTATGAMMGTAAYAAPEQLVDAAKAGQPADVFSLGAVLYELLTGKRAFESFDRQMPPLGAIPKDLVSVIEDCLATDLHVRPPDAVALLGRLPLPSRPVDLRPFCTLAPTEAPAMAPPPLDLPRETDAFIGRDAELGQIDAQLAAGHRFLTLLGTGGMGKTRLLLRAGITRGHAYSGGALWVDADAQMTSAAVGGALGLALHDSHPNEQIGRALHARGPMLLLLDSPNDPATASLVEGWLRDAPGLVVLAASRRQLGREETLLLDGLASADAAALFVARAASIMPGFRPTPDEISKITLLIAPYEGIPLAIELVAARLRVMPVDGLLARAKDPLRLASGGTGRHAALAEVIDSAWDALPAPLQCVFAQLSLFAGAFSLSAAESIVDLSDHEDAPWFPDVLQELCNRALLRSHSGESNVSMRMHPLLREYCAGRLDPAQRRAGRRRHALHFSRHGADVEVPHARVRAALWSGESSARRALLDESADILLATERMVEDGEAALAGDLGALAGVVYELRGPAASGIALFERLETLPMSLERRVALSLSVLASLRATDPARALALAQRTSNEATSLGDGALQTRAQLATGMILRESGRRSEAQETLSVLTDRPGADETLRATALRELAYLDADAGRPADALQKLHSVSTIARRLGNERLDATARSGLGFVLDDLHRPDEAIAEYETALALAQTLGDQRGEATVLNNLGWVLLRTGRWVQAERRFDASYALHTRSGSLRGQVVAARNLAQLAWRRGDTQTGERWTALALQHARDYGAPPLLTGVLLVAAEGTLHCPAVARHALHEVLALGHAQDQALLLLASLELASGDPQAAIDALDKADLQSASEGMALAVRAVACARLGRIDEAVAAADALEPLLVRKLTAPDHLCLMQLDRAEVAIRSGQPQRARERIALARSAAAGLEREGIIVARARFEELEQQLAASVFS